MVSVYLLCLAFAVSSEAYKKLSLDNPDVCSPNSKRRLKLGVGNKSGLVISQSRLGDHTLAWTHNFDCEFEVKVDQGLTHRRDGIFAVIQSMVLREHERPADGCRDYVQFRRRDGLRSVKYCGRTNAALSMDQIFIDETAVGTIADRNSFVDPEGELDVEIFIDKEPLLSNEETDILIVFTAYKSCARAWASERPCDENRHNDKCIWGDFFNDGYYNCPYVDCVDEDGCSPADDPVYKRESIGNKVLIGSVTSLLLTFGLFICCIYTCRKYSKLCWSDDFARPNATMTTTTNVNQAPTRVIQLSNTSAATLEGGGGGGGEPQEEGSATAPPAVDKDLPPSYDSLFPSR